MQARPLYSGLVIKRATCLGLPGTGKTSLAKGLASEVAKVFKGQRFQLVQVDPHSLTSSAMGKTQRAVTELFAQSIAEAAQRGPTVVLLDEVETLAADRSKLSLEANPVDVHRARAVFSDGVFDNRLDRRKPGTAGEQNYRLR